MIAGARYERITKRIRALRTLHDFSAIHPSKPPPGDSRAFIAASIGRTVEVFSRRVLDIPGVLDASRGFYRALRRLTGRPTA
jgi:hypothetical protein